MSLIHAAVRLPLRLVSTANLREHWAVKARRVKAQRQATGLALRHEGGTWMSPPTTPMVITMTRIAPRPLDGDNCQNAAKAVRDGVADWLKTADNDPLLTWVYQQRKGKPKEYAVEITVEEGG